MLVSLLKMVVGTPVRPWFKALHLLKIGVSPDGLICAVLFHEILFTTVADAMAGMWVCGVHVGESRAQSQTR